MRVLVVVASLIAVFVGFSYRTIGQKNLAPEDKILLAEAQTMTDRFIERFRENLNLKKTVKEFRRTDGACLIPRNFFVTEDEQKNFHLTSAEAENAELTFLETFFLQMVFVSSINSWTKQNSDSFFDELDPREIRNFKERQKHLEDPKTRKGLLRLMASSERLAQLYRKYMPKDALRNQVWKENVRYFEENEHHANFEVTNGWDGKCVSSNEKLYAIERGIFYLFFINQNGRLRLAGFGLGD